VFVQIAKSETSVNALFNAELRYLVDTYETGKASSNLNFKVLLDFSLGRRDDLNAMEPTLAMAGQVPTFILPEVGPLITLAYVAVLDLLLTRDK
jgi:hypothetical protein